MTGAGGFVTLSVLSFALTCAVSDGRRCRVTLGDRQRPTGEFDIGTLYAALDARRSERGISWSR